MRFRGPICILILLAGAHCGDGDDTPVPIDSYTLTVPVEIVRDSAGMRHIYAENDLDLFYAAGYQQAADRLFQLDMTRRAAVGTRAEVLGEDGVSGDIQAAALRFRRWGSESLAALRRHDPEAHNLIVAFTAGVNRRVDEVLAGDAPIPAEYTQLQFQPSAFAPAELLAIGFRIQFGFSSTLEYDILYTALLALYPQATDLPVFEPVSDSFTMIDQGISPPANAAPMSAGAAQSASHGAAASADELASLFAALRRYREDLGVGEGSNGWVVHGAHTDNGRPYLANDSHASLGDPNLLYLQHLSSAHAGGSFDVVGFGFVGVPGVQIGHNERVVWGATTNFADQTDLWSVDVRGDVALIGGEEVVIDRIQESFRVRLPDGSFETRTVEAIEVPGIGVILPDEMLPVPRPLIAAGRLMLGWRGFAPNREISSFLSLSRAQDARAARSAIDGLQFGMQNWMFASAEEIGLHVAGEVPDRGPTAGRARANRVLDGSDRTSLWNGTILDETRLPRLDGDRDFISTANNDPWGFTADNDPLNDTFYYGSFFAPQFRAGTVRDRLRSLVARGEVTRSDMVELQTDVFSVNADRSIAMLEEAVNAIATDPDLARWRGDVDLIQEARDLIAWDRQMTRESRPAALFRIWFALLQRKILGDDIGLIFEAIDEAQPTTLVKIALLVLEQDLAAYVDGNRRAHVLEAFEEALDERAARGNPRWGDIHRSRLRGLDLDETLIATVGDDATVDVSQCRFWRDGRLTEFCVATAGPVYRQVTGFAADGVPETIFNWPAGEVGNTSDWVEGNYIPWLYREDDVRADAEAVDTLEP